MEKQPLQGCRVLVVEDECLIADDISDWLQAAGASVIGPVSNASGALQSLRDGAVDVAVIDVNLGPGSDFQLAEFLTQSRVPFVFATGYDKMAILAVYRNAPRIEKPFNEEQLLRAVCSLADRQLSTHPGH